MKLSPYLQIHAFCICRAHMISVWGGEVEWARLPYSFAKWCHVAQGLIDSKPSFIQIVVVD